MAADGGRPRRTASVRFRVTAIATVAVVVVLVVTGIVLVGVQRRVLVEDLDDGLRQRAAGVAALVRDGSLPPTITVQGDDDAGAQVVDGGRVLASTANLVGAGPLAPAPGRRPILRTVHDVPIEDGSPFRLLSRQVSSNDGTVVVHAVSALDDIDETTTVLRTSLAIAIPAVAALLAALTWWLVGRTLRPVEAIRAEVAAISGSGLHRRVPEPGTGDEVDRLAGTMNAMLDRLEHAAQRQQQFVADASHELRSPLTRIRSELEVDLAHAATADPWATHRSVLEEAGALERLVDDLLHLARSDGGASTVHRDPVDLDDVATAHAERARLAGVRVDIAAVAPVQVLGDAAQLARAVGNVVDNAARHASSGVVVTLAADDGWAVLSVADDGPGIPPADRERVFERFTRLDDARTAGTGGSGLGLAIARDIVERHAGTIAIDPDHARGTRVVVRLPLL